MRTKSEETYFYDRLRHISLGINDTAVSTFLLLIAVRFFEAPNIFKSLIAASPAIGFIAAPFSVHFAKARGLHPATASFFLFIISAIGFLFAAILPVFEIFISGSVLAIISASMSVPLVVQMYQENYPKDKRGRFLSRAVMIKIAVGMLFADLAGRALEGRIEEYRYLMLVYFASTMFAAFCFLRSPSEKLLKQNVVKNPLACMHFVKEDKVFRNTLISWFFLGFGNLMMFPLRVEYLANPVYELNLSVSDIALLVAVVPNAARFVFSPLWGYIFDNFNFFLLRMALNACFCIGIIAFFTSDTFAGLLFGSIAYGISNAGGDIAWNLWVTKFAPKGHVADYMAVHSFFTGLRGIIAPFVAFYLISDWSMPQIGLFSLGLIGVSIIILIPEYFASKR